MRFSPLLLLLLTPAANLIGQSATSTVLVAPPASQSCPIHFSADRKPNAGLEVVKGNEPPHGEGLQITFAGKLPSGIVKASITVHGASTAARMVPAAGGKAAADSTETFQLTPVAERSSIWTKNMNAINWVELTRVEYADGNVWEPTAESRCTAAPSLLVLVSAEAR